MPTSARLFVYEGLRETTRTTEKKTEKFTWIPPREKKTNKQDFINVMICSNPFLFLPLSLRHLIPLLSREMCSLPYSLSVYLVLGSVHRVRPASSLRPHPQIEDDDRRGDLHSKFGATQFGRQSAHLLPIFDAPLPQSQVNTCALLRASTFFKFLNVRKKKFKSPLSLKFGREMLAPGDHVGDE